MVVQIQVPLYIFVTFSDVYTAVTQNICVADFPDHVKQMHEDMNHKFEIEFIVSYDCQVKHVQ